ncbi:MAG: SAM-dependent methyltransferase [Acetobacteraceae bacterium]|nr:SAM-dependent methyltransferase [Acetobacteraceae bacterium]
MSPERLDQFMARANAAYYASRDPFADFTTAPEITQIFGEILGLWCAVVWQAMRRPSPVVLAEAGPGRGTLMADALRAIRSTAADFGNALAVRLIETSPRLRELQALAVPEATWQDSLEDMLPGQLLLMANEFLDALPVRQFVRRGQIWSERYVSGGMLIERPAKPPQPILDKAAVLDGPVFEISETAIAFTAGLARHLSRHGGAALFIDYGPAEPNAGDSLQAIRGKRAANPFTGPGSADLTAHVDFPTLAGTAREAGVAVYGPVPQGIFLTRLGLFQRTDYLTRGQKPARAMALITAARRLVEPDQMGRLFKVMGLCHPGLPMLPGFEE